MQSECPLPLIPWILKASREQARLLVCPVSLFRIRCAVWERRQRRRLRRWRWRRRRRKRWRFRPRRPRRPRWCLSLRRAGQAQLALRAAPLTLRHGLQRSRQAPGVVRTPTAGAVAEQQPVALRPRLEAARRARHVVVRFAQPPPV
eukprot:5927732-Prymnesium_polylepis.1